jgi:ketosteroid isomerase-like protein
LLKSYHWIQYAVNANFPTSSAAAGSGRTGSKSTQGATRMSASRRSILAGAGAGLASLEFAEASRAAASFGSGSATTKEITDLVRRSADAHTALMRGDLHSYRAEITVTDDFTLMAPFGGKPTRGADLSDERWAATARFFRNGRDTQVELVQAYGASDMVVLALIERAHVGVGGLPEQDWALRVTLVFRRDGSGWRLAHRHADPIVKGISLEQAAAIARE